MHNISLRVDGGDMYQDLVIGHQQDERHHERIYRNRIQNAGSTTDLKRSVIETKEAIEESVIKGLIVNELFEIALSSPHNGNKKLDDWMRTMLLGSH